MGDPAEEGGPQKRPKWPTRRQVTRMGIAVSLALLLIGITAYFGYEEVFEGLKTFYSVFRGIYGADITTTITVVFGILSIIMIIFGILISRVQKQIGMIALMQPLTKDPKAYGMFLEYMSKKWFNKRERKKIKDAMERMSIKGRLARGGEFTYGEFTYVDEYANEVRKALSGEEMALQKILNVMEEINKKLSPKEEGGEKMPVVHVDVWEGFGEEKAKVVIQNITKVLVDLGIPAHAVEVIVHEIPKSHWGIGGEPASEKLKDVSP